GERRGLHREAHAVEGRQTAEAHDDVVRFEDGRRARTVGGAHPTGTSSTVLLRAGAGCSSAEGGRGVPPNRPLIFLPTHWICRACSARTPSGFRATPIAPRPNRMGGMLP